MKQKDIALIIILAVISGVFAILASHFFFATSTDRKQSAEMVDVLSSDFSDPPIKYFNASSIDPTQLIKISDSNNKNPFKDKP